MAKANMNELQRKALLFMKQGNLKKSLKTVDLAIKTNKNIAINFYIKGRIFQELMLVIQLLGLQQPKVIM